MTFLVGVVPLVEATCVRVLIVPLLKLVKCALHGFVGLRKIKVSEELVGLTNVFALLLPQHIVVVKASLHEVGVEHLLELPLVDFLTPVPKAVPVYVS